MMRYQSQIQRSQNILILATKSVDLEKLEPE